jgi:tetratricopeptide (TPR) repeat protein
MLNFPIELERVPRVISAGILIGLLIGIPIGTSVKFQNPQITICESEQGQAPMRQGTIYNEPEWCQAVNRVIDDWIHAGFECPTYTNCNYATHRNFEQTMTPQANEKFKKVFGKIGAKNGETKIFSFQQILRGRSSCRTKNGLYFDSFPLHLTAIESNIPYYEGRVQFTIKKVGAKYYISDFKICDDPGKSLNEFLKGAREASLGPISEKAVRLFSAKNLDPVYGQSEIDYFNHLSEAIKLNPNFALAYRYRAMLQYDRGNRSAAIEDLTNVSKLLPGYYPAFAARGKARNEIGENSRALEDLNQALLLAPNSYATKKYRAETLMHLCNYSDAIKDLKFCTTAAPLDSSNFLSLAEAYELSGNSVKAFVNYDTAVSRQSVPILQGVPVDTPTFENDSLVWSFDGRQVRNALIARGQARHRAGQPDLACQDFKSVLKSNSDLVDKTAAHFGIARTRIGKDHNWAIMTEFDKNMRDHRNTFLGHAARGLLLLELKDFAPAESEISAAIKIDSKFASLYKDRAQCRIELNKLSGAKEDANKAISLNPSCAEAFDSLATVYLMQNQPAKALTYFDKAIAIDSKYTGTFRRRGNALRQLGYFDLAFSDYDKSLALESKNDKALFDKGSLYSRLGWHKKAKEEYKKALKANPNCRFEHFELWFI